MRDDYCSKLSARAVPGSLDAWSEAIMDTGSHPQCLDGVYNVGDDPHFGSGLATDTAEELFDNTSLPAGFTQPE